MKMVLAAYFGHGFDGFGLLLLGAACAVLLCVALQPGGKPEDKK
jgi:hypothetical protein